MIDKVSQDDRVRIVSHDIIIEFNVLRSSTNDL